MQRSVIEIKIRVMKRILIILRDSALMLTMLLSAHEIIDLPLGWKCAGYMVLFSAALNIWTNEHK